MDDVTYTKLRRYLNDIKNLPNESAKTHRFGMLLGELFPNAKFLTDYASGIEKFVRIQNSSNNKHGRIDVYHGNAIIEFENSLKATEEEAKRQLRKYVAGIWADNGQNRRPLLCVASDGITWKIFRPYLHQNSSAKLKASDVELELLRIINVSEKNLHDFWIWLTSFLFRPGNITPTVEQIKIDFGTTSPLFSEAMIELRQAWKKASRSSEAKLKFETWQQYLTVTYGRLDAKTSLSEEMTSLFLKHTYLASIAKFFIWASLSHGKLSAALREIATDVLSGKFFETQKIENIVEDDFFQWVHDSVAESILAPIWEQALAQIVTYDLRHLDQDIFKGIYQELVDPKDRHDLGEYYTPEWLCERIVKEILPHHGYHRVLDPACGSGSFLRATIAHFMHVNNDEGDAKHLQNILSNVVGIDIHPLAVTIARATYLLSIRNLLKTRTRSIHVPVYLADSLFLTYEEVKQTESSCENDENLDSYKISFGGQRISFPEKLINRSDLFDPAISSCSKVAVDHARTGEESQDNLSAYLKNVVPALTDSKDFPGILAALWRFTEGLSDLIKKKSNSIWAFIIRNSYRPAMFRNNFDFIIGNPPWLSYRYIAEPEYQAKVKSLAVERYKVAPKSQKLMTQMELATVFLAHSLETFGSNAARLGFVMPRSILSGDQHENLRNRKHTAQFRLDQYWDLEAVRPIFNVPCCVLYATKMSIQKNSKPSESLPALEWQGKLPQRDISWTECEIKLAYQKKAASLIYLGQRCALSTQTGRKHPNPPSPYNKSFRQGAALVPRSFYFIQLENADKAIAPEELYWAETDLEQAKESKPPYQDVFLKGNIEGRFIFFTALSKHILPFTLLKQVPVVLPIQIQKNELEVVSAKKLKTLGFRDTAHWMEEAEKIWNQKRGKKANNQTLYEWLDYNEKLSAQSLRNRFLVLYNTSGTNVSAVAIDRQHLSGRFVVDSKLYWAACESELEAFYLAAILNAEEVNHAIKPFQSFGLQGERDIHKKILDLPIPLFDSSNVSHQRLAALAAHAHSEARRYVSESELPKSLAKKRAIIRKRLSDSLRDINEIVSTMLFSETAT